jgi:hypothetical protein
MRSSLPGRKMVKNMQKSLNRGHKSSALSSSGSPFSTVTPCNSTKDVLSYVDRDTLVIFDIDNTILTCTQMLGSDT